MTEHDKREAYPRGKAPNDAPTTLKNPDYAKTQKARREAEEARYNQLCGPVTVRKVQVNDNPR